MYLFCIIYDIKKKKKYSNLLYFDSGKNTLNQSLKY